MKNLSAWLVIDGGEVKSSQDGMVEGWGIVYGSAEAPDQSGMRDFFTKESHISRVDSITVPLYYDHGAGVIDEEIGTAVLTREETGWKALAQIDLTLEAGRKVYEDVKSSPHGFSTGALSHLVKRVPQVNGTNFLQRWVVGELSLTKRPAERKAVVEYVKSLGEDLSYEDAFVPTVVDPWGTAKAQLASLNTFLQLQEELAKPTFEKAISELEDRLSAKFAETVAPTTSEDVTRLEDTLKAKDEELADLRTQLSSRDEALTKAGTRIAQLEILAGAKEMIEDYKKGN